MDNSITEPHLPGAIQAEQVRLRLPSHPDWIQPAAEYLRDRAVLCGACDKTRAGKLFIALHEALTNAVVHGNLEIDSSLKEQDDGTFAKVLAARSADPRYAGRGVTVEMLYDGDRCQWTITDEGNGFDVERILNRQPETDAEALLASGRGILIMRSFLDEVRYELGGRRVVLVLVKASGRERRRQVRLPCHQAVQVTPIRPDGSVDWDAAHEALVYNISNGGMALVQNQLITTSRILIGLDAGGQMQYLPAEVRHCRQVGPDAVELGCCFRSPDLVQLPPTDGTVGPALEAFLNHILQRQLSGDDRRAHARLAYSEQIGIAGGPAGEPTCGFGRNLSKGGIAFLTTSPLPLEMRTLTLPQGEHPPLRIKVQVLRCQKILEGFYEVAARFVELDSGVGPPQKPFPPVAS